MALSPKKARMVQGDSAINGIIFEPPSDWVPPREFPSLELLRSFGRIGVDCECRDPNLKDQGPGSIRRDGYPVGFSLAGIAPDGQSHKWYFPTRHLSGGNIDEGAVVRFLSEALADPYTEKVFANALYDLEWLRYHGIKVRGRIHDVQALEALIDEESETGYSLEALSRKYLGFSKQEELLKIAAQSFGVNPKGELWKLHSRFVGAYGEVDALNPLLILQKQWREVERQELQRVYDLECRVIPVVHEMRIQGVAVDVDAAEKLHKEWGLAEDRIQYKILVDHGVHIDPWSAKDIAKVCDRLKIQYPRTEAGNPSFEQAFLDNHSHEFLKQIRQLRRYNSLGNRFVKGLILDNAINGRIHCQFHPLKGDENGVRAGRMAATGPNLQQVPARDPDLAPLIRGKFIPNKGEKWAKLDYSQQEPRLVVHYAVLCGLVGACEAAEVWRQNPSTDFYKYIAEVAEVVRKDAKTIYLGRSYGMGKAKLANDLGRSIDAAAQILKKFDERNPYVKELADACMRQVEKRGYIRTMGGRVCHFDHWIPSDVKWEERNNYKPIRGYERAAAAYPNHRLGRAFTHKSLNRLIQGSAGDMTKMAMVKNFEELGAVPLLQVHDELDYSVPDREFAEKLKVGMETCVQLQVPIVAELEYGDHWK